MNNLLRTSWAGLVISILALSCGPKEDRSKMARRPVAPAAVSGWARLPLDGPAQVAYPKVWLSDAQGTSIPFLVEREGLWEPRTLDFARTPLLGRDAKGRPTAEFTLKFPEGWQVRDREHLKVELELEGAAPWVCRVEVDRRMDRSAFLRLERDSPLHLFDLGLGEGKRSFYIPWDAQTYRVALVSTQGKAPKITGVTVTASTRPEELDADDLVAPRMEPVEVQLQDGPGGSLKTWALNLDSSQRIVGADILLRAPVAPIQPHFFLPADEKSRFTHPSTADQHNWIPAQGLVWNLPALDSKSVRVGLSPVETNRLMLVLPADAHPESVHLLIRREVLLFPAEAGQAYFLHTGGGVKQAPGNLAALPDSSRAVYSREPLKLGPTEADPHGLPILIEGSERTRPWLPWAAGLAVLLLGWFAWKLLKGSSA